jgi:rhodanese-related sulfurtransferase
MSRSITVHEAASRQKGGSIIVDVREVDEFNAISAPDAINVPLSNIQKIGKEAFRNMGVNPESDGLLMICRSGGRSAIACGVLGDNAINVEGGMLAWEAAGLPIR